MSMTYVVRPPRRVNEGVWRSRDGRWTFMRHWSDPSPQRWFAYLDDDREPSNEGAGHVRLRDVVDWAEQQARECPDEGACHHECRSGCFRVWCCGPLSGVFENDEWPEAIRRAAPRAAPSPVEPLDREQSK